MTELSKSNEATERLYIPLAQEKVARVMMEAPVPARSGRCTGRRTDPLPGAGTRIEDREDRAARFLEAAVVAGLNVLVAGRHTGRQSTNR